MNNTDTREPTLPADIYKPSLSALSYALRHPDVWPEGFVWDFNDCTRCAMGLANELWMHSCSFDVFNSPSITGCALGLPPDVVERIFMDVEWAGDPEPDFTEITPEMVADEIDRYIARAE